MAIIKVTKDGVSNTLLGSLAFAQQAYPTSEGYSHEDVTVVPTSEISFSSISAIIAKPIILPILP